MTVKTMTDGGLTIASKFTRQFQLS